MPTPPMLRSPSRGADRRHHPDPLVALDVSLMAILSFGLLLAGFLAVYDYATPGAEAPLVLWIAAVAVGLLLVNLLVISLRHVRRLRLGL